jgi:hypothetical protein
VAVLIEANCIGWCEKSFAIILGVAMGFGWRYVLYFITRRCEFEITYVTDYSSTNLSSH